MERILAPVLISLEAVLCYFVGGRALRRLGLEFRSFPERAAIYVAVGLGILAYCILGIGLLGGLNWIGFGLLIAGFLAWAGFEIRRSLRKRQAEERPKGKKREDKKTSRFEMAVIVMVGAILLVLVGGSLAPPARFDWDALAYHLAVPKIYLADGRIHYIPFVSHSSFPFTMEMLYTLGLFLNGPGLATLNHLLTLVLTLLLLWGMGRRLWGGTAGVVGAATFISAPVVMWEGASAYIDLGYSLYYLLAVVAFAVWWMEGKRGWLILSGIACGLCLGTKMTGAIAFGSLTALLAYRMIRERSPWRDLAGFMLPAILVASPWYVKSQIWTGNPTFPFFYNLFGGRGWDGAMAEIYRQSQMKFGVGKGIWDLLRLPFDLVFRHYAFSDAGPLDVASSPGVIWLCFLPPLLLVRGHDRVVKVLMTLALLGTLGWFFSMQYTRYLIPILAILSLATGYAAQRAEREAALRMASRAVVMVVLVAGLALWLPYNVVRWMVVLGHIPERNYLQVEVSLYAALEYVNETAPPTATVGIFGDTRGFYLDRRYFWADPNLNMLIDREKGSTAVGMVSELKRLGVSYMVVRDPWLASESREMEEVKVPEFRAALWEAVQSGLLRRVFDDGNAMVVRVR